VTPSFVVYARTSKHVSVMGGNVWKLSSVIKKDGSADIPGLMTWKSLAVERKREKMGS